MIGRLLCLVGRHDISWCRTMTWAFTDRWFYCDRCQWNLKWGREWHSKELKKQWKEVNHEA